MAADAIWFGAAWLRASPVAYIFVNASHILSIGLILGAILPLDLRLMGAFRSVPLNLIGPFLLRCAMTGVALAFVTGLWLFSVAPADYLANQAFLVKAGLLAVAIFNIGFQHVNPAFTRALRGGPLTAGVKLSACASFILWLSILVAGRWIGFI
ncbi:DUF2214 domain-containing protein [Asticcacaulis sp. ZE23SCel15]|uniref:DUF6644 family protein n=1 Tax=Asticcacaulis sp. ZE23SCel15 TaxID=3059027 RepID=UPI00265F70EE|nr:DUF6644 family protein [Asticcacaulis sp. ZE23SCel15]WKL56156.1 DUF2214 domain-containing protein [Asticcacaulis sp. ZE23SCel15]